MTGFHLKLTVVLVVAVAALAACTKREYTRQFVIADSQSYEATLFRQHCAICHGVEANGKEVNGKPVPSLRFGDPAKRSESEIYEQIANGKLPMPGFRKQLSEDEIRKMVRFVMRDLQGREVRSGQ